MLGNLRQRMSGKGQRLLASINHVVRSSQDSSAEAGASSNSISIKNGKTPLGCAVNQAVQLPQAQLPETAEETVNTALEERVREEVSQAMKLVAQLRGIVEEVDTVEEAVNQAVNQAKRQRVRQRENKAVWTAVSRDSEPLFKQLMVIKTLLASGAQENFTINLAPIRQSLDSDNQLQLEALRQSAEDDLKLEQFKSEFEAFKRSLETKSRKPHKKKERHDSAVELN